jgi:hypothetical protein
MDAARPTANGIACLGNNTVFRNGKTGSSVGSVVSAISTSWHGGSTDGYQQHPVAVFMLAACGIQIVWQFDRPFELAVRYLHLIGAASLCNAPVSPIARNDHATPLYGYAEIFLLYPSQIEL